MRANEGARIASMPPSLSALPAVSREEPHPKFLPATMKSPILTFAANSGLCSMNAIFASSRLSVVMLCLPGVMRSVFIEFPNFQTRIIPAHLRYALGSVIFPVRADAAAVAGEARYIFAFGRSEERRVGKEC